MSDDLKHLQSDEDVEEILKLALEKERSGGDGLRERLEVSAKELGISAEALKAAEAEYRQKAVAEKTVGDLRSRELELREVVKARNWERAKHKFAQFFGTSILLMGINFAVSRELSWSVLVSGILMAGALATLFKASIGPDPDEVERLARREQRRMNRVTGDQLDNEVLDLLLDSRKIDAIKLVREETGMGLKEAKEYVEGLERG